MSKKYPALLLDTGGIQRFIFGSNKLKENIGASQLVKEIFDKVLRRTTLEMFPQAAAHFERWQDDPDGGLDLSAGIDVGYIGGGNALLFLEQEEQAEELVRRWSRALLLEVPGVTVGAVCRPFDLNGNFEQEMKALFDALQEAKQQRLPLTELPGHSVTARCPRNGAPALQLHREAEKEAWVSAASKAKLDGARRAKKELEEELADLLGDQYTFTDMIDSLGQERGDSSMVAVVHIDGNEMGSRFQRAASLSELRKLSLSVEQATRRAFRQTVKVLIDNWNDYSKDLKSAVEEGKTVLPLRPIILGGDDITFVAVGTLGIELSRIFCEAFSGARAADGQPLSACAGVTLAKDTFPFYRAYRMAEQLCSSAKSKRLKNNSTGSWLDFHLAYGGRTGSIEEIRALHYQVPEGYLLSRPLALDGERDALDKLIRRTAALLYRNRHGEHNFSSSKRHDLREVLTLSRGAQEKFVQEQRARGRVFPAGEQLFVKVENGKRSRTPYFDMIELAEYYPDWKLRSLIGGGND